MTEMRPLWDMDLLQPHGTCLLWDPELIRLFILGHGGTAAAYFCIPVMMVFALRRVSHLIPMRTYLLFAAFIACCGMSHVWEIVNLFYSFYYVSAVWVNITGIVSIVAVFALPLDLRQMLTPPVAKSDLKPNTEF